MIIPVKFDAQVRFSSDKTRRGWSSLGTELSISEGHGVSDKDLIMSSSHT